MAEFNWSDLRTWSSIAAFVVGLVLGAIVAAVFAAIRDAVRHVLARLPRYGGRLMTAIPGMWTRARNCWYWRKWKPVMVWDGQPTHELHVDEAGKVTRYSISLGVTCSSRFDDETVFHYQEAALTAWQRRGRARRWFPFEFSVAQPGDKRWRLASGKSKERLVIRFDLFRETARLDMPGPDLEREYRWKMRGISVELTDVLVRKLPPRSGRSEPL